MTVNANAKLKFKHNEVVNHFQNGNCSRSDLSQIRSVTNQYYTYTIKFAFDDECRMR